MSDYAVYHKVATIDTKKLRDGRPFPCLPGFERQPRLWLNGRIQTVADGPAVAAHVHRSSPQAGTKARPVGEVNDEAFPGIAEVL